MDNIEEVLISIVNQSLDDLYKNDEYLLKADASERNIVFHFGRYLIDNLKKNNYFDNYNVDYEYNRDTFNEKMYKAIIYDNEVHRILPDIIIHKRGSNSDNILAIEFKKYSSKYKNGKKNDYLKLAALTDCKSHFKYKMGLFINLGITRQQVNIEKFTNGKHIKQK